MRCVITTSKLILGERMSKKCLKFPVGQKQCGRNIIGIAGARRVILTSLVAGDLFNGRFAPVTAAAVLNHNYGWSAQILLPLIERPQEIRGIPCRFAPITAAIDVNHK